MRCEEMIEMFNLHLDGELTLEMAQRVERHLLKCAPCAHEMRGLEQTRAMLLAAVGREEPSASYRERAAARLADALADRLPTAPRTADAGQSSLPLMNIE